MQLLEDYADYLAGQTYTPREYIEHQLTMTDEEKQRRTEFFTQQFAEHFAQRGSSGNN